MIGATCPARVRTSSTLTGTPARSSPCRGLGGFHASAILVQLHADPAAHRHDLGDVHHDDLVAAVDGQPADKLGGPVGVRRPVDGQQDGSKHLTVTSNDLAGSSMRSRRPARGGPEVLSPAGTSAHGTAGAPRHPIVYREDRAGRLAGVLALDPLEHDAQPEHEAEVWLVQ